MRRSRAGAGHSYAPRFVGDSKTPWPLRPCSLTRCVAAPAFATGRDRCPAACASRPCRRGASWRCRHRGTTHRRTDAGSEDGDPASQTCPERRLAAHCAFSVTAISPLLRIRGGRIDQPAGHGAGDGRLHRLLLFPCRADEDLGTGKMPSGRVGGTFFSGFLSLSKQIPPRSGGGTRFSGCSWSCDPPSEVDPASGTVPIREKSGPGFHSRAAPSPQGGARGEWFPKSSVPQSSAAWYAT